MSVPSSGSTSMRGLGVPPSFDLGLHFRNLRAVILPAIVVGAVFAALAYVLTGSAPSGYVSTVVAQVRSADATVGDGSLGQLTAPYIALSTDSGVLTDVQEKVGYDGTVEDLQAAIVVSQGSAPALLSITATGPTAEEAENIARQVALSMDSAVQSSYQSTVAGQLEVIQGNVDRVGAELSQLDASDPRTATLQSEFQTGRQQLLSLQTAAATRLVVLATPINGGSQQSSAATTYAGVAGIVFTILTAEFLVFLNGRPGNKISKAWARRVARKYEVDLRFVDNPEQGGLPPGVSMIVSQKFISGELVLVLEGAGTTLADYAVDGTFVRPLDDAWWLATGSHRIRLGVVIVALGAEEKESASASLKVLAESGLEPILIVQTAPKLPRKSASRGKSMRELSHTAGSDSAVGESTLQLEDAAVSPVDPARGSAGFERTTAANTSRSDVTPAVRDWDPTVEKWSKDEEELGADGSTRVASPEPLTPAPWNDDARGAAGEPNRPQQGRPLRPRLKRPDKPTDVDGTPTRPKDHTPYVDDADTVSFPVVKPIDGNRRGTREPTSEDSQSGTPRAGSSAEMPKAKVESVKPQAVDVPVTGTASARVTQANREGALRKGASNQSADRKSGSEATANSSTRVTAKQADSSTSEDAPAERVAEREAASAAEKTTSSEKLVSLDKDPTDKKGDAAASKKSELGSVSFTASRNRS